MRVAMVLAAGLGTRLRPLTDHVPKPLCPVGDKPQIDHILATLARAGFERAVVNTHHLHEQFTDAWASAQPLEVVRIHEPQILGTGGGVANAKAALGEGPVLVWNADILVSFDVAALIAQAQTPVTLVVSPTRPKGEGTIGLTDRGTVARVRGARAGEEVASADYAGIAVLSQAARAELPIPGCLVGDLIVPMVERHQDVATFSLDVPFRDTGSLSEYLEANLDWLKATGRSSYIDATAQVAPEAKLEQCVIGKNARVETQIVRESVVWPAAVVHASLERAIAAPFATVGVSRAGTRQP